MSTSSSTPTSQITDTSQTPLQIAEAKMKAAAAKQLEIRYRNWVLAQPQINELRESMDYVHEELRSHVAKYNKAISEEDEVSAQETEKAIHSCQLQLDNYNVLIHESVGQQNWKEEADADYEILKAFREVWTLKGSST